MKGKQPQIVLLGNNAGNNLGDAAILATVMDSITKELPDAKFYVPSTKPSFITKNYGHIYNVKAVDAMPWTGSIRLFGIPTLYYMYKSDLAFICDGIIFGKKLFNPLFNFLITLVLLLPFAKLFNCKFVCYSCGIGPFPGFWSKIFAKWVINGSDLIAMRENDSIALAKEIGVTQDMHVTGDAAFLNQVSAPERGKEILKSLDLDPNAKYFGINVTKYVDGWLYEKGEKVKSKESLLDTIVGGIKIAQEKTNNEFTPLIFSTHPMDEKICWEVANKLNTKVIDNTNYLSHDIQSVMLNCELSMGMRLHFLILSSAVYSPIIGLIYAPKVRGYMRLLGFEKLGLELSKLETESLANTITESWNNRASIEAKQRTVVDELKSGAKDMAKLIKDKYFKTA